MAQPQTQQTNSKPAEPSVATKTQTVDLFNPTIARRVIYDGIEGSMKPISLAPGETKRNVTVSSFIANELRARTRPRGKERSDLIVYEAGKAPSDSAPEPGDVAKNDDEDADDGK